MSTPPLPFGHQLRDNSMASDSSVPRQAELPSLSRYLVYIQIPTRRLGRLRYSPTVPMLLGSGHAFDQDQCREHQEKQLLLLMTKLLLPRPALSPSPKETGCFSQSRTSWLNSKAQRLWCTVVSGESQAHTSPFRGQRPDQPLVSAMATRGQCCL